MRSKVGRPLAVLAVMLASTAMGFWLKPTHFVADTAPKLNLVAIVPRAFAGWTIDPNEFPIAFPPELQAFIDRTYDQVLERTYTDAHGHRVMLSMDYVRHSEKYNLHRPEVCYPAQGFIVERDPEPVRLQTAAGVIDATRLVARRGNRNEPITYWVIIGAAQTRLGMPMRWLQMRSALTGSVPDGLFIRISTIGADEKEEFATQAQFANDLVVNVAPADRPHLLGAPTGAAFLAETAIR
jgi:EpsI family protein